MRFSQFTSITVVALLATLGSAIPTGKSTGKAESGSVKDTGSKSKACKRDGGCENLFVVHYNNPGAPRHWALFLTPSESVSADVQGIIYHARAPRPGERGILIPDAEKRAAKAATSKTYEDAKLLGTVDPAALQKFFTANGKKFVDEISAHNTQNIKDIASGASNQLYQSDCQHWVIKLVDGMAAQTLLPESAKAIVAALPKRSVVEDSY